MFSFLWWGGAAFFFFLSVVVPSAARAASITLVLADGSTVAVEPGTRGSGLYTLQVATHHRIHPDPSNANRAVIEETIYRSFEHRVRIVAVGENDLNRGAAFALGVRRIPVRPQSRSLPLVVTIHGLNHVLVLNPVDPARYVIWMPLFPDKQSQRAAVRRAQSGEWHDAKIPVDDVSGWNGLRRLEAGAVRQIVDQRSEMNRRQATNAVNAREFNTSTPNQILALSYTRPAGLLSFFADSDVVHGETLSLTNLRTLITAADDPRVRGEALRALSMQKALDRIREAEFWGILEPLFRTSSLDFKIQLAETCLIETIGRPSIRALFRELVRSGDAKFLAENGASVRLRPILVLRLVEAIAVNQIHDPQTVALLRGLFFLRDPDLLKVRSDFALGATGLGRRVARWFSDIQATLSCEDALYAAGAGLEPGDSVDGGR